MAYDNVDNWFDRIMIHAKANYGQQGWDNFVECIGLSDFRQTIERQGIDTYEKAFTEYCEWCKIHAEMQAEHDAEADSGW